MTVVSTLDVHGLTAQEYRVVMDELGVETRPFDRFVEQRFAPAGEAIGLDREMTIAVTPLHNFFAPRLTELPTLVASLPGAPTAGPRSSRAATGSKT
jgi:hypothetical protein